VYVRLPITLHNGLRTMPLHCPYVKKSSNSRKAVKMLLCYSSGYPRTLNQHYIIFG
jgi:hypothetical protein